MRLVLDACVLYPPLLRDILLGVARGGGFVPLWSARILAEWQIASAKLGPEGSARTATAIAALQADWPRALIQADAALDERLSLPDPADAHVLATAMTGGAEGIVTLNLRDFPRAALGDIYAISPDDLLMRLWLGADAAIVEGAVAACLGRAQAISGQGQSLRPTLKRVNLPRLGKALGGEGPAQRR